MENYNYAVKKILTRDPYALSEISDYSKIFLYVYNINTSGKYPFLQIILSNYGQTELGLPILPIYTSFNREQLKSYSKVYLSGILQVDNFDKFDANASFDGFYEYDENLYLFFDISTCGLDSFDDTYSTALIRYALIDEIINHKHVCNIPIISETSDFFTDNISICHLMNEHHHLYEIPVVGYVGKQTPEKIQFTYTFGESAKNKSAILGPHFYFTGFNYSIRQGGWSPNYKPEHLNGRLITDNDMGRYTKGGIIRFALFPGRTKYVENMPNDPIDESEIKKERLRDTSLDMKREVMTLRISDHDANWVKHYDSVYLGNIELDDGSFLEDIPMLVLKDYNQQIPLSYHFIDKSKLGEKFMAGYKYGII